jgi:hypothetical protein
VYGRKNQELAVQDVVSLMLRRRLDTASNRASLAETS